MKEHLSALLSVLENPPPRRLRITPARLRENLALPALLLIGSSLLGLLLFAAQSCRRNELWEFAEDGVETRARITSTSTEPLPPGRGRGSTTTIQYEFSANGETFEGEKGYADPASRVGDEITIVYLPDDPSRNEMGPITREGVEFVADANPRWFALLPVGLGLVISLILVGPNVLRQRRRLRLARRGTLATGVVQETVSTGVTLSVSGIDTRLRSPRQVLDGRALAPGDEVLLVHDPRRPTHFEFLDDLDEIEPV